MLGLHCLCIIATCLEALLYPLLSESGFRACESFRWQPGQMGRKHLGSTQCGSGSGPIRTHFCPLPSLAVRVWSALLEIVSHTHTHRHTLCHGHLSCSSSCVGFLSVSLGHFHFFSSFLTSKHLLTVPSPSVSIFLHPHLVITAHSFPYQISIPFSSGPPLLIPSLSVCL